MNTRRKIVYAVLGAMAAAGISAAALIVSHPEVVHGPNWRSHELAVRATPFHAVSALVARYEAANAGQLPSSMEDLESVADAELLADDARRNRVFRRAVLARDVVDTAGRRHRWMALLLITRDGMFGALREDHIFIVAEGSLTLIHTADEARQLLGAELVTRAYDRHRQDIIAGGN